MFKIASDDEEFGLFHSYDLHDFGLLQLRTCCIELRVSLKPGSGKPISLNGKYKILFHRNLWIHENKTAFIIAHQIKTFFFQKKIKNNMPDITLSASTYMKPIQDLPQVW